MQLPYVIMISRGDDYAAHSLIVELSACLGRSTTKYLDEHGLKHENPKALTAVLHEFVSEDGRFLENQLLLEHTYVSFLVVAQRLVILELLSAYSGQLKITACKTFEAAYVSGSLLDFMSLIYFPTCTDKVLLRHIRCIANRIYEKLGDFGLFRNATKIDKQDGTFELKGFP